jgi:hypothetical protein
LGVLMDGLWSLQVVQVVSWKLMHRRRFKNVETWDMVWFRLSRVKPLGQSRLKIYGKVCGQEHTPKRHMLQCDWTKGWLNPWPQSGSHGNSKVKLPTAIMYVGVYSICFNILQLHWLCFLYTTCVALVNLRWNKNKNQASHDLVIVIKSACLWIS